MASDIRVELPKDWQDENDDPIFPIGSLTVIKGMAIDGEIFFSVLTQGDMHPVDALGMAHFAVIHCEDTTREYIHNAVGQD